MKKFIRSLWPALMTTLLYMALGSPLAFFLYILLVILGIEDLLFHVIAVFGIFLYVYQIHQYCADEGPS